MKRYLRASKKSLLVLLLLFASVDFAQADDLEYVSSMFWSGINDIYIQNNYAYCAFENGLEIVDISNPDALVLISQLYFQGKGKGIWVANNYAYLADYQSGVKIIDVHDPANPIYLATVETSGLAIAVCAGGNYIFVANASNDLQIINVTDPANPVIANPYHTFDSIVDVYFENNLVFAVVDGASACFLLIIDVSDPVNPVRLDNYHPGGFVRDIEVSGDTLYLAGDENLYFRIIDISDPTVPASIGSYNPDRDLEALGLYGNYAYLTSSQGMHVVNISDPANPTLTRICDWEVDKMEVSGEHIFGTIRDEGISVVNLSDPVNPALRSSFNADWDVRNVYVNEPYAYVATGWSRGLHIVDISSPDTPMLVGSFEPYYGLLCLDGSGDYIYGVDGISDFLVIDVSNPAYPVQAGECAINQWGESITVQGDYAYVSDYNVDIVNISNPQQPFYVSTMQTPGYAVAAAVSGNYVFIADADSGMRVMDISDPYNPQYITTYRVSGLSILRGIFIDGDYAYLALEGGGLRILNIADPAHPTLVAQYSGRYNVKDVYVAGNLAYVIDYWNGLIVFDMADPRSAEIIAEYQIPGRASRVYPSGDYVFVSAKESMVILRLTTTGIEDNSSKMPQDFALLQNYPNPFNATTMIKYYLPDNSPVAIDIYDMLGRKVETLLSIKQAPGLHSVEWNAGSYSSGLYFYNLKANGVNEIRKAILIK